jgi:hypothetical protein
MIDEHTESEGSSSYAPVEFGGPVPDFSRNTTLLLRASTEMRGYQARLVNLCVRPLEVNPYNDAAEKSEDLLLRKRDDVQATNQELVATLYCRLIPYEERRGSPGVETG